jgi:hypothetical protein
VVDFRKSRIERRWGMAFVGKAADKAIVIEPIRTEIMEVALLGTSPLIMHRMSEDAVHELLFPKGRKTTADKASSLKHDPIKEYRASTYMVPDGPTLLSIKSSAVKGAMATAALDLPGANKARVGRLVYVLGDYVPVYGVPKVFITPVKSSDMNHTPDIRTRAILPTWLAVARIRYVVPIITATSVINLLAAGGLTAGEGDWRPEKGKGDYGQFEVVNLDDERAQAIINTGGRAAQQAAMDKPESYDEDSGRILAWFLAEVVKRGKR